MISLLVAMDRGRGIGRNNDLLFKLPDDMKHFREVTMGKPLVMGRRTFDSIGRALPGRRNIVISRQADWCAPGCEHARSLEEALRMAGDVPEVVVIGGAQIYREALKRADRIYLTRVDTVQPADVYFPELDPQQWHEVTRRPHAADEKHPFAFAICTLDRVATSDGSQLKCFAAFVT
ncbi:MAG: dihydrofolate reductase [Candidatus Xenobia bacterium]